MPDAYEWPFAAGFDVENPRHIYIFETFGSSDTTNWKLWGEGDLKEDQSWSEFGDDFRSGNGELDNFQRYGEGEGGVNGPGNQGPGEDSEDGDEPGGAGDDAGDDDGDPGDGGDGEDDGDGDEDEGGDGDEDEDEETDEDDDGWGDEGNESSSMELTDAEFALSQLYDILAALEAAMVDIDAQLTRAQTDRENLQASLDEATARVHELSDAAAQVEGIDADLGQGVDDLIAALRAAEAVDPIISPSLSDIAVDSATNPAQGAEPVMLYSGAFLNTAIDLTVPSRGLDVIIGRTYHSQAFVDGPLGPKWRLSIDDTLRALPSGKIVRITGDFTQMVYAPAGDGYVSGPGCLDILERDGSGWRIRDGFGTIRRYDATGALTEIRDRYGNRLRLTWAERMLTEIRDPGGRIYRFLYDEGRLAALVGPDGLTTTYGYDAAGRLSVVIPPAADADQPPPSIQYSYSDSSDPRGRHQLSEISEVGGASALTITYGTSGSAVNRVVRQMYEGSEIRLEYGENDDGGRRTILTDRAGVRSFHDFDDRGRRCRVTVFADGRTPQAPSAWITSWEYNDLDLVNRVIRPGGDVVEYIYDEGHAEWLSRGNLRQAIHRPGLNASDADSLIQRYEYGPFNQVTRIISEDGTATDLEVDAFGNTIAIIVPAVPGPGGVEIRPTISYAFNGFGQVISRTDPGGLVTNFDYYDSGPRSGLLRRVDEVGHAGVTRAIQYVRDNLGRIIEHRDRAGLVTRWKYDMRGRPISAERDGVEFRRWTYSIHDRITNTAERRLEPDGTPSQPEWVDTVFSYDSHGRVISSHVEADGAVLQRCEYDYDSAGRITRTSGPGQVCQEWDFDERGYVVSVTDAPETAIQRKRSFQRDANGAVIAMSDPLGAQWRYELDTFGRTTACTDPLNQREELTHDRAGRVVAVQRLDVDGVRRALVELDRDALGRVCKRRVAALDATGEVTSWLSEGVVYDSDGNAINLISASGAVSTASYNAFGDLIRQADALDNEIVYEHDETGAVHSVIRRERLSAETIEVRHTLIRDRAGRVIASKDSAGRTEKFTYDGGGRPSSWVRADGVRLTVEHDLLGRLVSAATVDPATGQTWAEAYNWDAAGCLSSVRDAKGRTTSFEYDGMGRLASVTDPLGVVRQRNTWDAGDRLVCWEDARGVRVDQIFDPLDRVVERSITAPNTVPGARTETYSYDALGNAIVSEADGIVTTATFDSRNLRLAEVLHGRKVTRTFDDAGRVTTVAYPSGVSISRSYDDLGRPLEIEFITGSEASWPGTAAPGPVAHYEWGGRELPVSVSAGALMSDWEYDALGRPLRHRIRAGSRLHRDDLVIRDAVDRVNIIDDAVTGMTQRLEHDARDLLTTVESVNSIADRSALVDAAQGTRGQNVLDAAAEALTGTGARGWRFHHDDAANRIRSDDPAGSHDYEVDAADRLVRVDGQSNSYDQDGHLLDDGELRYAFDYAGRLCRIIDATGMARWEAVRDAFGRIASVTEDGVTRHVVHDGDQTIEAIAVGSAAPDRAWIWGARPSELLLLASNGADYHAATNWHGDLALLVSPSGELIERYDYSPDGARTVLDPDGSVLPASAIGNELGYLTLPHLPGEQLVLAGARALHTRFGRFISPDPSGYLDGVNLYSYAAGDPYSRVDRTGRSATFVGGALGLALGAGWAVGSMINAGIHEATDGTWGEQWQGFGHYSSQIAQFTASGAMIGAAVDLAPVGGGAVSAGLMGGGVAGLMSAPGGDWGEWAGDAAFGGVAGVAFWGAGRLLSPLAGPIVGRLAVSGLGRLTGAAVTALGRTAIVTSVGGAMASLRTSLAVAAENTWGNSLMSRLAGPAMREHAMRALAGEGLSSADLALMRQMHAETMESLSTRATTWSGFQTAYWKAARQTAAFQELFPNITGSGAPFYETFGRLNIHHLHGRIRDVVFQESNLMLVPNALDTPFLHSQRYLTGTQQHLIRRGLRRLFPRQWFEGGLGAVSTALMPDIGDSNTGLEVC